MRDGARTMGPVLGYVEGGAVILLRYFETNSSGAALMAHMRDPRRCPIVDFSREMGNRSTRYGQNMAARGITHVVRR